MAFIFARYCDCSLNMFSVHVQLGSHPLFQRLASVREHKVFSKGKEVADDLRERWETSDSPFVHRIQVRLITADIRQQQQVASCSYLMNVWFSWPSDQIDLHC